jgi:hypothetical protein
MDQHVRWILLRLWGEKQVGAWQHAPQTAVGRLVEQSGDLSWKKGMWWFWLVVKWDQVIFMP